MLHRTTTLLSTVVIAFLAAPVLNAVSSTAAQQAIAASPGRLAVRPMEAVGFIKRTPSPIKNAGFVAARNRPGKPLSQTSLCRECLRWEAQTKLQNVRPRRVASPRQTVRRPRAGIGSIAWTRRPVEDAGASAISSLESISPETKALEITSPKLATPPRRA